jgi:cutinase
MKFNAILSFFAAASVALPTSNPSSELEVRQAGSITRDDLSNGASSACPPVIFIYARGSTELGNLVSFVFNDLDQVD